MNIDIKCNKDILNLIIILLFKAVYCKKLLQL